MRGKVSGVRGGVRERESEREREDGGVISAKITSTKTRKTTHKKISVFMRT